MSPRQLQQLVLLAGLAVLFIVELVDDNDPGWAIVGLVAVVVTAVSLLRYYLRGGQPLDRGGRPFWRRGRRL